MNFWRQFAILNVCCFGFTMDFGSRSVTFSGGMVFILMISETTSFGIVLRVLFLWLWNIWDLDDNGETEKGGERWSYWCSGGLTVSWCCFRGHLLTWGLRCKAHLPWVSAVVFIVHMFNKVKRKNNHDTTAVLAYDFDSQVMSHFFAFVLYKFCTSPLTSTCRSVSVTVSNLSTLFPIICLFQMSLYLVVGTSYAHFGFLLTWDILSIY